MTFERSPALLGEREPGPRPFADEPFVDLHVAGLFKRAHLLGKSRVTNLDVVPGEAELDSAGGRQQSGDGKANRMPEQAIQLMAWMAQRRQISQAVTNNGITPTSSLRPKW